MINILDLNGEMESRNELVILPSGSFSGDASHITCADYSEYQTYGRDNSLTSAVNLYNPFKNPGFEIEENKILEESRVASEKIISEYMTGDTKAINTTVKLSMK